MTNAGGNSVVRDFVSRLDRGDEGWSLLTRDVVLTVVGSTPLSGRFVGIDMIRRIFWDTAERVVTGVRIGIDCTVCDGERVAARLVISGCNAHGVPFNQEGRVCSCLFAVRKHKIQRIDFFPDTSLIEIALFGRRFVADA